MLLLGFATRSKLNLDSQILETSLLLGSESTSGWHRFDLAHSRHGSDSGL